MPTFLVQQLFDELDPEPDVILVTSFMTYWYPAVRDAVSVLRQRFPKAKILLGGIYATLCSEHARKTVKPDVLFQGESEEHIVEWLANLKGKVAPLQNLDDLPFPAYDLYPNLKSVALLTSRGCPNRCTFCASHQLMPRYRRRSVKNVVEEIEHWHRKFDIHHFAFFDDALLHRADSFVKPMLRQVIHHNWPVQFYTPNGLAPRHIDEELAELLYHSGVKNIRLSFETVNPERQKRMSSKVTSSDLETALNYLENAGYNRRDIGVYLLMGLPDQSVQEVRDSAEFVHQLGASINLASFSPVPGTDEWRAAIRAGLWHSSTDLLLSNKSLFPIWSSTMGYEPALNEVKQIKALNQKLLKD